MAQDAFADSDDLGRVGAGVDSSTVFVTATAIGRFFCGVAFEFMGWTKRI